MMAEFVTFYLELVAGLAWFWVALGVAAAAYWLLNVTGTLDRLNLFGEKGGDV